MTLVAYDVQERFESLADLLLDSRQPPDTEGIQSGLLDYSRNGAVGELGIEPRAR